MKKYIYSILMAGLAIIASGCSDSFLDKSPSDAITTGEAITSLQDVIVANNGLYSLMASTYYYNSAMFLYGDMRGDDMQPTYWSSSRSFHSFYMYQHSTQNPNNGGLWGRPYYIVRNAWNIIRAIENGDIKDATADQLDNYKGQALAIIALCHFDLTRLYGYPFAKDNGESWGVQIVDHAIGFDENPERSTVAQCYDFIIDKLKEAIPLLSSAKDNGHINAYAARALLARVYLYCEKNDLAFATASQLIEALKNNGDHYLVNREAYQAMFNLDNKFGPEALFQIANTSSSNNGRDCMAYMLNWWGYAAGVVTDDFGMFIRQRDNDIRNSMVAYEEDGGSGVFYYILTKYPGSGGYWTTSYENNYTVIRMSELYLIAAEAGLKNGGSDRAKALAYLNEIAMRANPANEVSDADFTLDKVLEERRLELIGEGHRFFDMLRNGKTIVRKGGKHLSGAPEEINWDYFKCVLPISQTQFTFNPEMPQNPGYAPR